MCSCLEHYFALLLDLKEILGKEKVVHEEALQAKAAVEKDVETAISQASRHADVYAKVKAARVMAVRLQYVISSRTHFRKKNKEAHCHVQSQFTNHEGVYTEIGSW